MSLPGVEVIIWNVIKSVLLMWLISVIYDWLQMLVWRRKYNLKGAFPLPLIGTLYATVGKHLDKIDVAASKKHGPVVAAYFGCKKCLTVYDFGLLKKIFMTENSKFYNRFVFEWMEPFPLNKTILLLKDTDWKRVRSILTPAFSAAKLKLMYKEMNRCAEILTDGLVRKAKANVAVDSKQHFGCYSMDVIASTAFGIKTDSYGDPNDPFVTAAQKAFATHAFGLWTLFPYIFPWLSLSWVQLFGISFFFPRNSTTFFTEVCKQIMEKRRQEQEENDRMDLLQLMMNAESQEEEEHSKKKLTVDELLAQGFLIFIAGYETVSTLLMYLSYVLATHPDIQDKLIAEIDAHIPADTKEPSYDVIMGMPYLDQVVCETLRMYPPIVRMNRQSGPAYDIEIDGYWFPKDTMINYSIWYIHYEMGLFEDPYFFKPERFSTEEKAKRDPMAFMAFGHGPRNCIGKRMAALEAKIAAVYMLRKLKFVKCNETEEKLELVHDTFLRTKKPIKVALELR